MEFTAYNLLAFPADRINANGASPRDAAAKLSAQCYDCVAVQDDDGSWTQYVTIGSEILESPCVDPTGTDDFRFADQPTG